MLHLENVMGIGAYFGRKGNTFKKIHKEQIASHPKRAIKLLQKHVL